MSHSLLTDTYLTSLRGTGQFFLPLVHTLVGTCL